MLETLSLLEVKNLTTRFDLNEGILSRPYARVHAVENISFEIKRGETLSLVGERVVAKPRPAALFLDWRKQPLAILYSKGNLS